MPCKNPKCQQNNLDEDTLLRMTAEQLRMTETPVEITSQLGAASSCAKCSCLRMADWLDELRYLKHMRTR